MDEVAGRVFGEGQNDEALLGAVQAIVIPHDRDPAVHPRGLYLAS